MREAAVEVVPKQPHRPVSDLQSLIEIIRESRTRPLCQSPEDGVDVDLTLHRHGSTEHYRCVTGALLRFGERSARNAGYEGGHHERHGAFALYANAHRLGRERILARGAEAAAGRSLLKPPCESHAK